MVHGAGAIIFARDTKLFLIGLRGHQAEFQPATWCGFGGTVDPGEDYYQTCKREIQEETGYLGPILYVPGLIYREPELVFQNYIGVVDKEFVPKLNEESDGYVWCKLHAVPSPIHPGLQAVLDDPVMSAAFALLQSSP